MKNQKRGQEDDYRQKSPYRLVNDEQLATLRASEDALFAERTKLSKAAFDKAHDNLLN